MELKFGDYEIRNSTHLNFASNEFDVTEGEYEIVKWYDHDPTKTYSLTEKKEYMSTRSCYVIAYLKWTGGKDPYFKFESCGNRFLEACVKNEEDYDHKVEWHKLCDWIMTATKLLEYNMSDKED